MLGETLKIHGYKHNGKIHKSWDESIVLYEDEEMLVCANNKTEVTESDGRKWRTKEPAILFFYKHEWFNIIGQFKKQGIYCYCNIASPYIISDDVIKYIDYDLDLRVFPDGGFKILDRKEYNQHKKQMKYSDEIDSIVNSELQKLIQMVKEKKVPFDGKTMQHYFDLYNELKK